MSKSRDVGPTVRPLRVGDRASIFHYADCRQALSSNALSSAEVVPVVPEAHPAANVVRRARARQILYLDSHDHRRIRAVVVRGLRGVDTAAIASLAERATLEALAGAGDTRGLDLVSVVVRPVVASAIATVLGVPQHRSSDLLRWSTAIGVTHEDPSGRALARARALSVASDAIAELEHLFRSGAPLIDGSGSQSGVIPGMLRSTLDPFTAASNAALLLFAGLETTVNALSVVLGGIISRPGMMPRLRQQPTVVAPAVRELLRLDPPIQGVTRRCMQPRTWGTTAVEPGEYVDLLLAEANRDAGVFANPDRFCLDRPPRRDVTFGAGKHACPGEQIAMVLINAAVAAVMTGTRRLSGPSELDWYPNGSIRRLTHLKVAIEK